MLRYDRSLSPQGGAAEALTKHTPLRGRSGADAAELEVGGEQLGQLLSAAVDVLKSNP
jgi:hypothetical protein